MKMHVTLSMARAIYSGSHQFECHVNIYLASTVRTIAWQVRLGNLLRHPSSRGMRKYACHRCLQSDDEGGLLVKAKVECCETCAARCWATNRKIYPGKKIEHVKFNWWILNGFLICVHFTLICTSSEDGLLVSICGRRLSSFLKILLLQENIIKKFFRINDARLTMMDEVWKQKNSETSINAMPLSVSTALCACSWQYAVRKATQESKNPTLLRVWNMQFDSNVARIKRIIGCIWHVVLLP